MTALEPSLRAQSHRRPAARPARDRKPDAGRWSFSFPTPCCSRSSSPSSSLTAKATCSKSTRPRQSCWAKLPPTAWPSTNTPGGEKILSAIRDAIAMQKAVASEGEAAMLPMRIGKQARSFRLRTTPMRDSEGRLLGTVTVLEDVTSLQDIDRFKTQFSRCGQPQAARSPFAVASRLVRPYAGVCRRTHSAAGRTGDTPPARNRRSSMT